VLRKTEEKTAVFEYAMPEMLKDVCGPCLLADVVSVAGCCGVAN